VNDQFHFSPSGFELLKRSEGLLLRVGRDRGNPVIGYGHDLTVHEQVSGLFINGITRDQADSICQSDVALAENIVKRLVRVALTQGQFDALVDFVFNLGVVKFEGSTLLRDLNAGQYEAAAEQLQRWDHEGDVEVAGLKARRQQEFNLWHGKPAQ